VLVIDDWLQYFYLVSLRRVRWALVELGGISGGVETGTGLRRGLWRVGRKIMLGLAAHLEIFVFV